MYRTSFDLSVYFVLDPAVCGGCAIEDVAEQAIKGGITMLQLRNKCDAPDIVLSQAQSLKAILADSSIPFIMNDHVEIAAKVQADGVHIGQGDMSAMRAREIIGDDVILGLTAYSHDHYDAINPKIIDYVGTGPYFPTLTKPDKAVLGADGFAELVKDSPVPVVGIGGITPENAGQVIKGGAQGVAMMRAISESDNPVAAARRFVCAVQEARA